MSTVRAHATWFRSALLLGLVQGEEVVAWADAIIAREHAHDDAVADVSLTAPGDLSALRFALQPLCDAYESPAIAAALFDRVARDLASGGRSAFDTFALLKQARQMLKLPAEHDAAIRELMVANYLDLHTPGGADAVRERIGAWLTRFAGAADRLFAPHVYHTGGMRALGGGGGVRGRDIAVDCVTGIRCGARYSVRRVGRTRGGFGAAPQRGAPPDGR